MSATDQRRPVFAALGAGRHLVLAMQMEHDSRHLESLAFVVMPDHFHWLFQLAGSRPLSICINNVKAKSAKAVNRTLGRSGKLWQKGFYDRAIRRDEDVKSVARYIISNPLRARLVGHIGEYPLWDAKWL